MPKRKKLIVAAGKPVEVDLSGWSLDMAVDKCEPESFVSKTLPSAGTIRGFWDGLDEMCLGCRRSVNTQKEIVATLTTQDDPPEYIGVLCRECALKVLDGGLKIPLPT